jgi:hypothetical protein
MMPHGCKPSKDRMIVWVILIVICTWIGRANAQQTAPPATQSTSQWIEQLHIECRQLADMAVRRPYGWAWPATQPASPGTTADAPAVDLNAAATPAAGLVLALAARELDDPQLFDAALNVAHGLAAAQQANGRIPKIAIFGASAGGREPSTVASDRSSTIAALGLYLILRDQAPNDERLGRSTNRALFWLLRQQVGTGGWPTILSDQPQSRRLLQLDSNDFRNATLALYLAGDCLQDAAATRAANKSIDLLLRVRFAVDRHPSAGLWALAYQLSGEPLTDDPQARWIDLKATSESVQTLIGAALLANRSDAADAVDQAIRSMLPLPHDPPAGWERFYNPDTASPIATTRPAGMDGPFAPPADPNQYTDPAIERLDSLFRSAAALRTLSRDDFRSLLSANRSMRIRIALALCGLDEAPFAVDLPLSQTEAQRYLREHDEQWQLLAGPPPEALADRIRRIHRLMVRLQIERRANQTISP